MSNLKVANGNKNERAGFDKIVTFVTAFEFVANECDGMRIVVK